ncbi:HNH endonuclease [Bdellovibrio bacteriovorus]|uniref:HNH endonuclease n=1 Tax=Bdellovibrio bacteriovorus str. Tiberius TaxID=1069642 RepID=K7ZB11_BDEBC|nr:HNH endonuclease signature motif containing protein [Bdellovibrio bacteriovorus]AFY02019.1 HNH endonuclease [Bdellovibrio bacteriovorus str. Tiberius]
MNEVVAAVGASQINLSLISNSELLSRMQNLVRTERKITHLILLHIAEIEARKLYAELGYDGMFPYLTRGLGYSEGSAYRRLHSARLLAQVPQIANKIESGSLNLSQLTKMQKCLAKSEDRGEILTVTKTLEVLQKIEDKNTFETEKTLAQEMNVPIESYEMLTPQRDDSVRLLVTLTKEHFSQLELSKSLLSHVCIEGTWAQVIGKLAEVFNKKKLEGRIAVTQSAIVAAADCVGNGAEDDEPKEPRETGVKRSRSYLPRGLRRELFKKAQYRCEYRDTFSGKKCQSSYQLQIDHRIPVALGGSDRAENLRVLCRTHNLAEARRMGIGIKAKI